MLSVPRGGAADVSLITVGAPGPTHGDSITYTQSITNNGPAAASGVSFTEATPTNSTFESVPGRMDLYDATTAGQGPSSAQLFEPLAGTSANIVVVVNVPAARPPAYLRQPLRSQRRPRIRMQPTTRRRRRCTPKSGATLRSRTVERQARSSPEHAGRDQ